MDLRSKAKYPHITLMIHGNIIIRFFTELMLLLGQNKNRYHAISHLVCHPDKNVVLGNCYMFRCLFTCFCQGHLNFAKRSMDSEFD